MKILNLLLLFLIFIGTLYCIRSLRALHGKVSKKSEQISREINKAALENKKLSMTAYRQTEAFIQLTNLLQFKSAIPPTRSWAASPDLLLFISETVKKNRPTLVVELGSGVSTLVTAKSGARKVISIDNSEEFGGKTRELLKEHKVRGAEIRIAPLRPYANGSEWYDVSMIKDLRKIDLLIVDGPPGSKNPEARYPALKEFKDKWSAKAVLLLMMLSEMAKESWRKISLNPCQITP